MTTPSIGLTVKGVSFRYRHEHVLDNVDLEVPPGQFLGVLGPNGCGKTTLLGILAGVLNPESGTVLVGGEDVHQMSRRRIAGIMAVVPQESAFTFPYTALEVVLMGRAPHLDRFSLEGERDLGVAKAAMERTDAWQFRDRHMDELSGGEKQRVILARALAQEARVLLLDEPTSALDLRHQADIHASLADLNLNDGLTVVMVSHDLNAAARMCCSVALMDKGGIVATGEPDRVFTAENLKKVYRTSLDVTTDSKNGHPLILLPAPDVSRRAANS